MGLFQSKPECCKPEEISKHEECLKEKLLSNEVEELVKEGSTPTYTEEFKSTDNEDAKSTEILEATYTEETITVETSYTVDNIVSDDICVEDFDSSILTKASEESNHVEGETPIEEVNNIEEPDTTEETKKKKKSKRNKKQVTTV